MKKRPPDGTLALPHPAELDLAGLLRRAGPVLLIIGAWLLFRPYLGIVHDARLYVAQALNRNSPDIFGNDLFFRFGSQDDFTVISYIFAPMIERLGIEPAALLFVAVGQALWLAAATTLCLRLVPHVPTALAALVVLIVMPAGHAGGHMFEFGAGIATSRILAEALALWALHALIRDRFAVAVALAVAAALVHPLVGMTALALGWVFLVLRDIRWLALGVAGSAGIVGLALAGFAPFDNLLRTMDSEWFAVVETRNYYLFPLLWDVADWGRMTMALAMAAAGVAILDGWQRRLMLAALVGGVGGLVVNIVGADVLHNVLVIQLQFFRMMWLLYLFAHIALGVLLAQMWRTCEDGPALAALLLCAWLPALLFFPVIGAVATVAVLALAVARLRGAIGPLARWMRVVAIGAALALVLFLAAYRVFDVLRRLSIVPDGHLFWETFGSFSVIDAIIGAVVVLALLRIRPAAALRWLAFAALAFALIAATSWDRRDSWGRVLTAGDPVAPFEAVLAPDDQVYFDRDIRGAWLLLRRPSYISDTQGAGIAFNRDTALTFRDRATWLEPLAGRALVDMFVDIDNPPPARQDVTREMLVSACRTARGLDAIVLERAVAGAFAAEWHLARPIHDIPRLVKGVEPALPREGFYLYLCATLR